MAQVELVKLSKQFPDGSWGVRDCSLAVDAGQLLVVVGPSGSGKSTVLRMLAGLEEVSGGEIRFDDTVVNARSPQERNVAMVFQNYALYPHMTVRANLAFPLRMRRMAKREMAAKVAAVAATLGLADLLDRRPAQLSGGQRQRVAMGRALVRDPALFLMDEPLSNLDARLRAEIRTEIATLVRQMGTTTVYVTHDQVEAMTLGQRVAVLHRGRLQQVGTPQELYHRPANTFVAGFLGSPGMNLFRTVLRGGKEGGVTLDFGGRRLPVDTRAVAAYPGLDQHLGQPLIAGLRPEAFVVAESVAATSRIDVQITAVEPLGHETLVHFTAPGVVVDPGPEGAATSTRPLTARLAGTFTVIVGDPVGLGVDTRHLMLFGPDGRVLGWRAAGP
jgi:multiple sugar transport system ATP-binding protein